MRGSVSYTDIDEIVALIDAFDSETVCLLLVAYGYASDPRKEASEATPATDSGTASFPSTTETGKIATDEDTNNTDAL